MFGAMYAPPRFNDDGCLLMAFAVHGTVLAAAAAGALALLLVLYHTDDDKHNDTDKGKCNDYCPEIFSQPCEHNITPLCFDLYLSCELGCFLVLLHKDHIEHECQYQSGCYNSDGI